MSQGTWLIDSVPGSPLSECLDEASCRCAASALAKLQVDLTRFEPLYLADPSRDFRLSSMSSSLDRDFDRLREAHGGHNGDLAILSDSVLDTLRGILSRVTDLSIPDSFVHFDSSPSNLFLEHGRLRLIDFDIAGWGFPFLTCETLLRSQHLLERKQRGEDLRREYRRPWRAILRDSQLSQAMALTPVIRVWATLKCLLERTFEIDPEHYWHPRLHQYLLTEYAKKLARLTNRSSH
jgi:Ser/Thr protein kinase RdoA (MazF antagonist)